MARLPLLSMCVGSVLSLCLGFVCKVRVVIVPISALGRLCLAHRTCCRRSLCRRRRGLAFLASRDACRTQGAPVSQVLGSEGNEHCPRFGNKASCGGGQCQVTTGPAVQCAASGGLWPSGHREAAQPPRPLAGSSSSLHSVAVGFVPCGSPGSQRGVLYSLYFLVNKKSNALIQVFAKFNIL